MTEFMELLSQIQRPMNTLTDYIFGIFVLYWGHRLFWHWSRSYSKMSTRFWGLLFLFAGLGALAGGTSHGFKDLMLPEAHAQLWQATLILLVCSTFLLFLTGVKSFSHPRWQRFLTVVGLILFVFELILVIRIPEFILVMYYYAPVLVIVMFLNYRMYSKYRKTSHKFATFGLLALLIASILKYMQIGISESFDHNDVYHIGALFAFYLLYIGAKETTDNLG